MKKKRSNPIKLLISVIDAAEVKDLPHMPDFLDIKEPVRGALGMPELSTIAAVREAAGDGVTISAAIGDAANDPAFYAGRAVDAALAGADIVKVGLKTFERVEAARDFIAAIRAALDARAPHTLLVPALYADIADESWLRQLPAAARNAGAWGCLIDTYEKGSKRLGDHFGPETLAAFTAECRSRGLQSVVAGGLMEGDLVWLDEAEPDIVGFRTAVAKNGRGIKGICPKKAADLTAAITRYAR